MGLLDHGHLTLFGFAMFLIESTRIGYMIKPYDYEMEAFLSKAPLDQIIRLAVAANFARLGFGFMVLGSLFK